MKKPYLDRIEFHNELTKCKKAVKYKESTDDNGEKSMVMIEGVLSRTALDMFMLLARETSRDFYFDNEDDKKDAISTATHDLFRYWRNFKESNVVQFKLMRNFIPGETITVNIFGYGEFTYTAGFDQDLLGRLFKIGPTINSTIKNFESIVNTIDGRFIAIFVDKIKNKITLMDKYNSDDLSVKSYVKIQSEKIDVKKVNEDGSLSVIGSTYAVMLDKKTGNTLFFQDPPNGFSYFTSIARNGCLKSINKIKPKQFRNGNMLSLSHVNSGSNGFYNITLLLPVLIMALMG